MCCPTLFLKRLLFATFVFNPFLSRVDKCPTMFLKQLFFVQTFLLPNFIGGIFCFFKKEAGKHLANFQQIILRHVACVELEQLQLQIA